MATKMKLDETQISNLILEKSLQISNDIVLEINREQLILNKRGLIHPAINMSINFESQPINPITFSAEHVQKLICEHLNLQPNEVIFINGSAVEFEFKIHFAPNKEWQIIVYEYNQAKMNAIEFYEDQTFDISTNLTPQIGPYKQLGSSNYYFRWFED